mmetsp:Transcript_4097/g.10408  ORF Transcript_4097/g.10408 Transcript_4097/m.10408 type:complete len:639 (-) Transcript_4097:238-2154(-)
MILLGFELEDVLRVVVGIALGLLTVYRRELSCNRDYHPDENDEALGDSAHYRFSHTGPLQERDRYHSYGEDELDGSESPSRVLKRSSSSSALHSMAVSNQDDEDIHTNNSDAGQKNEDSTEELLESAGMFLSGGPFLYIAIAIFDHVVLVLTSFISTFRSVSSLLHRFRFRKENPSPSFLHQSCEPLFDDSTERIKQKQDHLYSVAWNAATEYYTGITAKLDRPFFPSRGRQMNNNDSPSGMKYRRSRSTGNLQNNLSDKRTRALFREMVAMANSGCMDVTLLPSDAQIVVFSYLYPQDVLSFTCTNKSGRNLLEDSFEMTAEECRSCTHTKNTDTALLIWKRLFERDYSWILTDWKIGEEALLRSMTDYERQHQQQQHDHPERASNVFWHLASIVLESENPKQFSIESMMDASSSIHPTSSMKEFYFEFTETWLNYTIAGCNSTEKCLIGLHGHVFDISNFVEDHPGSTETLLLQAGRDATVFFESMGHSLGARKLAAGMCVVVNGQCARVHYTEGERSSPSFQMKVGPMGPLFSTWGLIKPSCKSLGIKRNIQGFLIPRRRAMPRFQGGLHRIRERMMQEEELQLTNAARWGDESIGPNGMFGGVHVYYDPFRGWKWWYTNRDFNVVFIVPPTPLS